MGTILQFKARRRRDGAIGSRTRHNRPCDVVIFPGVRIERQGVDLGHRLLDTAGRGPFSDIARTRRPRRTS